MPDQPIDPAATPEDPLAPEIAASDAGPPPQRNAPQ